MKIELTKAEVEVLVDACSLARDHICSRSKYEWGTCKKKKQCDLLSELELKIQGK